MQEMLGLKAVVAATCISRATIYVLMSEGAFPRPRRVGKRAVRWNSSEISNWLASRPFGGSWNV
jgi:prophage regulatory protein